MQCYAVKQSEACNLKLTLLFNYETGLSGWLKSSWEFYTTGSDVMKHFAEGLFNKITALDFCPFYFS
jgi:hypothetical protein